MHTSCAGACAAILTFGVTAGATASAPRHGIATPPDVTVHREVDRLVFADARGMVLYTYDKDRDTPGTSSCTLERHCSREWPPLPAAAGAVPTGDWSVVRRPDGARQWAYKGMPVYRYVDDLSPGTASGDNARGGLWHALTLPVPAPSPTMPSGITVKKANGGWVFADHQGRALHAVAPQTACDSTCLEQWQPVSAPMLAREVGEWRPIRRADETLQWSFRGQSLYVRRADTGADAFGADAMRVLQVDVTSRK